jgi:hypothetical protein
MSSLKSFTLFIVRSGMFTKDEIISSILKVFESFGICFPELRSFLGGVSLVLRRRRKTSCGFSVLSSLQSSCLRFFFRSWSFFLGFFLILRSPWFEFAVNAYCGGT